MRACLIIKLRQDSTHARVVQDAPILLKAMKDNITSEELVFQSGGGVVSGFFIETTTPLSVIKSRISGTTGFMTGDSIIIFEVGDSFTGTGFSRAWTWLQRHPPSQ